MKLPRAGGYRQEPLHPALFFLYYVGFCLWLRRARHCIRAQCRLEQGGLLQISSYSGSQVSPQVSPRCSSQACHITRVPSTVAALFSSDPEHQPEALPVGRAERLTVGEHHGLLLPEDGMGCGQRLCGLQVSGCLKVLECCHLPVPQGTTNRSRE